MSEPQPPQQRDRTGRHAILVGAGILVSKLAGLARQHEINRYFGQGDAADAFAAALRIPNFLNNLLGEGVLSASFIPVYARLVAEGDEEEAGRVAGAVGSVLSLVTVVLVILGMLATPVLIDLIAAGFPATKRALTVRIVRVLFPSAGLMVLSSWCLGILNSHRKFFLSYAAPVLWNAAMIVTVIVFSWKDEDSLAVQLAWGSVAGAALMVSAQLPVVLRLARRLRPNLETAAPNVRQVGRSFGPVVLSRGVVQISGYVDGWIATWLGTGAASAFNNAQMLNMLPVSLFGMAISAAELPAMSSKAGTEAEIGGYLQQRLNGGLRQIAFLIVPSAMAFLALGDVIAAALFQYGKFGPKDSVYVWAILAGSAVGLLASTMGRLYSNAYYALRDTRRPLRFAVIRIALTTVLGCFSAFLLPGFFGIDKRWGVAGLTASAGIAGWVEFALLRGTLNKRIGQTGLPVALAAKLWSAAAVSAVAAWGVKLAIGPQKPYIAAIPILGAYGVIYFGITYLLRVPECSRMVRRFIPSGL